MSNTQMADIDYQALLDAIINLPANASKEQKKNVLTTISTGLIDGNEPDARLLLRAVGTRASLQYAGANVNMDGWIRAELEDYKRDLQDKGAVLNQPQQDVEMAVDNGGRRRHKSKKSKKAKRYTRRR